MRWIVLFLSCCLWAVNVNDYDEWKLWKLAAEFLPKEPVVVLAGGGDGKYMVELAHQWPGGKVYALEPNPKWMSELRGHAGWFSHVTVEEVGLDGETRTAPFYLSENGVNPRLGSLLEGAEGWKWYYCDSAVISVRCRNLEEWAGEKGIQAIDFLSLNVGGVELRVLQSIPRLLPTIRVICVETHEQEFRKDAGLYREVKRFLQKAGFEQIQHWHVKGFQGYALFVRKQ
jgi:FkbM family methyltransferase